MLAVTCRCARRRCVQIPGKRALECWRAGLARPHSKYVCFGHRQARRKSCGLRTDCLHFNPTETVKSDDEFRVRLWSKWLNWYRKAHWREEMQRSERLWSPVAHPHGTEVIESIE